MARLNDTVVVFAILLSTCFAQTIANCSTLISFSLPNDDLNTSARAERLAINRDGYRYGVSPLANVSFFLNGTLGSQLVQKDVLTFTSEAEAMRAPLMKDAAGATAAIQSIGGLKEIQDYLTLYEDQWLLSNPEGINAGFQTNYTQDLYFSMERLSINPFSLARVRPSALLNLEILDEAAVHLSGQTAAALQKGGRLFVSDHSAMASLPLPEGKFAAACTVYFFMHPETDDFLPLSITTNVGANLTYTPLDDPEDWFLAKTLYESNENFFIGSFHLGASHATAEIVHTAALRTLADQHPVRGFLDRIMFRAYAIRPAGAKLVFNKGGQFDQSFAYGSTGFDTYTSSLYHEWSGHFQSMYFEDLFSARGLSNCSWGPELKHFPFYQDAAPIHATIHDFATSFVNIYYPSEQHIQSDDDLQAWFLEANGSAKVLDFPLAPITRKQTLIDVLTHMAYATGVLHHAVNSGALASSWTLPLHPVCHWQPLPTEKGIMSILPFLPDVNQSISQVIVENQFNRPNLIVEGDTLFNMFADEDFIAASDEGVVTAVKTFTAKMEELGRRIGDKQFDDQGLCQGMPFVYGDVNPLKVPFFLSI